MEYTWDFTTVWRNWEVLLQGISITIALSLASIAFGLLLSFPLTLIRKSKLKILAWFSRIIIEIFRDLPVLVVLVWLFYCLPIFLGDNLRLTPFTVAVIGLGLNFSALQAEIFRAGLEAIPPGQLEVARTLGFSRFHIVCYIVIPQVLWRTLAPTLGQAVNTLKLTSLASFIAVDDVFHATTFLIQETYRPLEFYTTLAVLYLLTIMPLSFLIQTFERYLEIRFGQD